MASLCAAIFFSQRVALAAILARSLRSEVASWNFGIGKRWTYPLVPGAQRDRQASCGPRRTDKRHSGT